MVADHVKAQGGQVFEQTFTGVDPKDGRRVELANLIGSWHPERDERVLICAHYDTRPHADEEFDPARYRQPFLGANDGASGVALLMEIAHHLQDLPTEWGVDLVLLDAEELVYGRGRQTRGEYFLGSRAFAGAYARARKAGKIGYEYHAGILLDMVGGKDLTIEREPYSVRFAPWLVDEVWAVAERLQVPAFVDRRGTEVYDDHLPLNQGGIPTIDLIDFDYPHWHLITDTPEQCAPESLAQVGRVVTGWLTLPKTETKAGSRR
jgi:Zn-dependent M28 family amino/carboxypeptidase